MDFDRFSVLSAWQGDRAGEHDRAATSRAEVTGG
jgi:hypothetical protein